MSKTKISRPLPLLAILLFSQLWFSLSATAQPPATANSGGAVAVKSDTTKPTIDVAAIDRERIMKAANAALTLEPITITKYPAKLSEGGPNDFYSNGDYWWPDPKKPDGLPYIKRDGESNPANFDAHRLAMRNLRDAVAALAAAYKVTGDERYVKKSVELLGVFFLDPKTRMNPSLKYVQAIPGITPGRGIGIIDALHLAELALAVEAMQKSPAFPPESLAGLKQWFRELAEWMTTSKNGKEEASAGNNHSVAYFLQVAAFARLTGDEAKLAECRRQFKEVFVIKQMARDGSFPGELRRTKPYGYSIFQLDNMATLCQLLSSESDNLWMFALPDERGIRKAMEYLYPYLADKAKWPLKPDVQAWEGWPSRQPCLLFAGLALGESKYLDLWKRLPADPTDVEVRRNIAITQPILWIAPAAVSVQAVSDTSKAEIRTPKPPRTPRINGPAIFGVRPGSPFVYRIPATGDRPMQFSVDGLPAGLKVDPATGQISGSLKEPGEYVVTFRAKNALGTNEKKFKIVVGEKIALTPPLGWNSWNCWGPMVNAEKVLKSAHAMVDTGLINHGWSYINIDDAWQAPKRGGPFNAIQGNEKFPDMQGLCDEIHGLGLKVGIYSTPCITSYARYIGGSADNPEGTWTPPPPRNRPGAGAAAPGAASASANTSAPSATAAPSLVVTATPSPSNTAASATSPAAGTGASRPAIRVRPTKIGDYSFAVNDAKQWAAWGIDYMKYDWNPNQYPETKDMADALRACGRDIVYSLSNSMPFQNIPELSKLANCWRTTGDIRDNWNSMYTKGFGTDRWEPYAGPGHWNDPDMMVVGWVDVGRGRNLHASKLTPDEQYTHVSLWALVCSPMLLGCDMEKLDEFTLNLLTNDEILAVNQDSLGKQALCVSKEGDLRVYAKDMEDGSKAVGLFNMSDKEATVSAKWSDLKISGPQKVRDLWRQKDLGQLNVQFDIIIAPHGAEVVRIWSAVP